MATESPVRLLGGGGARNWPGSKDSVTYGLSTSNVAAQELGLVLNGQRFHGDRILTAPNRCGSAPPSIEGSLAASGNLKDQLNSSLDGSFESLSIAVGRCGPEEQLRAHPDYLAYYCSNVNLNPRLPPPIISQENRRLVHHIGGFTDNWRMPSFDDSSKGSLFISRPALSTHKEESEDDRSPRLEFNDSTDKNTGSVPQQFTSPLQGRHKSIVDLIQEDFPRTPSPVYNNQLRSSSHNATEQAADPDALIQSSHDSSDPVGSIPNSDVAAVPVPCSASSDRTVGPHSCHKGKSISNNAILVNVAPDVMPSSNISRNESEMMNIKTSNDVQRSQHARPPSQQNSLRPQGASSQILLGQSQMIAQGIHRSNYAVDHLSHGQSKLSSVELQPVSQTTGTTPPLYATAAAYGTPYYPNMQPSSLLPSQFSMGGYTSIMQPLITGYPPQNAISIPFGTSGVSTGGTITPGVDLQHFYKFYGPLGVAIQPSFPDPLYMPYLPHLSVDAYTGAGRYDPIIPGGSTMGSPPGTYDPQTGPSLTTYSSDQRPQVLRSGTINTASARRGGTVSPNYYGSAPNIGVLLQYPTSPLTSPVFQGSPGDGTSFSARKAENVKLPLSYGRTPSVSSGWQGQRGRGKIDDPKSYSFLEELRSSRGRRFELADISGRIVEFSADQHGSRYIQQKLETCSIEEKASVFEEVLPHASALMTDVFGNYVIQKFFEHGNHEQRKELANQLAGHILPLSLQMYGCRVIQKAFEVIELDQKTQLVHELDGHVMRCVRDQNGNHVIQKCIECVPTEKIGFIISAFRGQVAALAMHPYGCRVIQRVLEHCTDEMQSHCIVDEILQSVSVLAQDQYGNYVTQHVLEKGQPHERSQIISKLAGQVVQMSQHKFASNVIEKCLEHGDTAERELLIEEIVGQTEGNNNLLIMMKDQFANYVIQKILETSTDKQREVLLSRIRIHLQALKKYTYGKHIVARVEQLCGEATSNLSDGMRLVGFYSSNPFHLCLIQTPLHPIRELSRSKRREMARTLARRYIKVNEATDRIRSALRQ